MQRLRRVAACLTGGPAPAAVLVAILGEVRAIWWSLAFLMVAVIAADAAEPRRVLLLHAFGHAYSPWSDMAGSFRAELIRKSPEPIDLYEVSLDTARAHEPQGEKPFVDYLQALFSGRKLDLIVPVGAPAAFFVQPNRPQLFPTVRRDSIRARSRGTCLTGGDEAN